MDLRASAGRFQRVPLPMLIVVGVLLPLGPVGVLLSGRERAASTPSQTLAQLARRGGCKLREFEDGMRTNPPVTGRFVERILADDGSYVGRRPPSRMAAIHALMHGRVLFQYRPDVRGGQLRELDRLARTDLDGVLLFENRTMPARVAATAYLSIMTCPGIDRASLQALEAFRARRRAFGQRF
jgi:hypothetical protein